MGILLGHKFIIDKMSQSSTPVQQATLPIRDIVLDVDIFSLYSYVLRNYGNGRPENSADSLVKTLERDLLRLANKGHLVLHFDGPPSEQKRKAIFERFPTLTEEEYEAYVVWKLVARENLTKSFESEIFVTCQCENETDICIVKNGHGHVVTADSDYFFHVNILHVYRPMDGFEVVQHFSIQELLLALGMTRAMMAALAIVSGCDYCYHVAGWGLVRNYNFFMSLSRQQKQLGTEDLVRIYCRHHKIPFAFYYHGLQIFVHRTETPLQRPYIAPIHLQHALMMLREDMTSLKKSNDVDRLLNVFTQVEAKSFTLPPQKQNVLLQMVLDLARAKAWAT